MRTQRTDNLTVRSALQASITTGLQSEEIGVRSMIGFDMESLRQRRERIHQLIDDSGFDNDYDQSVAEEPHWE